jgi:hypothetical protein
MSGPPLGAAITCAKGRSYDVSSAEATDDTSAQSQALGHGQFFSLTNAHAD